MSYWVVVSIVFVNSQVRKSMVFEDVKRDVRHDINECYEILDRPFEKICTAGFKISPKS